jgi:hypothetical protein
VLGETVGVELGETVGLAETVGLGEADGLGLGVAEESYWRVIGSIACHNEVATACELAK